MNNTRKNSTNQQTQLSNNERIINRTNQRRQKNRRKRIIVRSLLCASFFCVGIILALTLFFDINKIVISGDTVYSNEDIIEASEISEGDNLIFISNTKLNEKIPSKLAYVGSVKVKRRLPSTLEIVVTKTDASMGVVMNGYYVLLDKNGKVLEKDLETVGENIILTNLGEIKTATVGEIVVLENEKVFAKLQELLNEIDKTNLKEISAIDLSDIYNIKLVYQGRITLELGETDKDNLGKKLALGKVAIEKQNEENDMYRGTINLTVNGKGYWSEEVSTTEPETEDTTTETTEDITDESATEATEESTTEVTEESTKNQE